MPIRMMFPVTAGDHWALVSSRKPMRSTEPQLGSGTIMALYWEKSLVVMEYHSA